jgi:hypothetical protein
MMSKSRIHRWIIVISAVAVLIAIGYWQWPPRHSYRDHKELFPAAYLELESQSAWCQSFLEEKERLPTPEELQDRFGQISWIYSQQPEWSETWGVSGRDYILTSTTGEWNLFLQSWDGARFELYNEW